MLQVRGAYVKVLRLPALSGLQKVGFDDYLVAEGADDFDLLLVGAREPNPRFPSWVPWWVMSEDAKKPSFLPAILANLLAETTESEYDLERWAAEGNPVDSLCGGLGERLVQEVVLAVDRPGARDLVLVEDSEFHTIRCRFAATRSGPTGRRRACRRTRRSRTSSRPRPSRSQSAGAGSAVR